MRGRVITWREMYPGRRMGLIQDLETDIFYGFSTFDVVTNASGKRVVEVGEMVEFDEGPGRLDKKGKHVTTAQNVRNASEAAAPELLQKEGAWRT